MTPVDQRFAKPSLDMGGLTEHILLNSRLQVEVAGREAAPPSDIGEGASRTKPVYKIQRGFVISIPTSPK